MPPARTRAATTSMEAYYEVPWSKKVGDRVDRGMHVIYDPEDERWDGMLMEAPYRGDPQGYLNVAEITRIDGEVVKELSKGKKGKLCHMNVARGFLRTFYARQSAGDPAPWDQHTRNRDLIAEEKEAREQGDKHSADALREALTRLAAPVAGSKS